MRCTHTSLPAFCKKPVTPALMGQEASAETFDNFFLVICRLCAACPAPTFAEYEQALVSVGCEISRYYLKEENDFCIQKDYPDVLKREKPDIIFLCNPNNPTGITIPQRMARNIRRHFTEKGRYRDQLQRIDFIVDRIGDDHAARRDRHTLASVKCHDRIRRRINF